MERKRPLRTRLFSLGCLGPPLCTLGNLGIGNIFHHYSLPGRAGSCPYGIRQGNSFPAFYDTIRDDPGALHKVDREGTVHKANLFDMAKKYADVLSTEAVISQFRSAIQRDNNFLT